MNDIEKNIGHDRGCFGVELDGISPPRLEGQMPMTPPRLEREALSIPQEDLSPEGNESIEKEESPDVEDSSLWNRIKEWVQSFVGKAIGQSKDEMQVECKRRSRTVGSRFKKIEGELQTLQTDIKKLEERLVALEFQLSAFTQWRTCMEETIKGLKDVFRECQTSVVALKQSQVMAAVERKNEYGRFLCDFLALVDLIDEKLKQNHAKQLLDGLSRKIFEMMSGVIDVNGFMAYIDNLKSPEVLQSYGVALLDSWGKDLEEIKHGVKSLEGLLPEIDERVKEFDKRNRFADMLILPSEGEDFDPLMMKSRMVEPGEESRYVVESVQKIGMDRNHLNPEITKALVSVSEKLDVGGIPANVQL